MKLLDSFKFELPYNFDKELIYKLLNTEYVDTLRKRTAFMYLPCFRADGTNTREEIPMYKLLAPTTRNEYAEHIHLIQDELGIPAAVLIQRERQITEEQLKYYTDLGVRNFIVSSVGVAYKLKHICSDVVTVCSITRKLTYTDILNKDLSMFDVIVLDFPFERGLDRVKSLPKQYTYSMLVNNRGCFVDCQQYSHWFDGNSTCRYFHNVNCGQARALDLSYADYNKFSGYVNHLKMQGRQDATECVLAGIRQLFFDDNKAPHSEAWLNYSEDLGLFDGSYKRNIQVFRQTANRTLQDFNFDIGARGYSWTIGREYTIVVDITYGILYVTSDNGVLKTFFPLYFDVFVFLKTMFDIIICNDDIIPEAYHMIGSNRRN